MRFFTDLLSGPGGSWREGNLEIFSFGQLLDSDRGNVFGSGRFCGLACRRYHLPLVTHKSDPWAQVHQRQSPGKTRFLTRIFIHLQGQHYCQEH